MSVRASGQDAGQGPAAAVSAPKETIQDRSTEASAVRAGHPPSRARGRTGGRTREESHRRPHSRGVGDVKGVPQCTPRGRAAARWLVSLVSPSLGRPALLPVAAQHVTQTAPFLLRLPPMTRICARGAVRAASAARQRRASRTPGSRAASAGRWLQRCGRELPLLRGSAAAWPCRRVARGGPAGPAGS